MPHRFHFLEGFFIGHMRSHIKNIFLMNISWPCKHIFIKTTLKLLNVWNFHSPKQNLTMGVLFMINIFFFFMSVYNIRLHNFAKYMKYIRWLLNFTKSIYDLPIVLGWFSVTWLELSFFFCFIFLTCVMYYVINESQATSE